MNARRHEKKRLAKQLTLGMKIPAMRNLATLDGASSARWFPGCRPDVAIDRSPPCGLKSRPAVAEPRTWLLREGWRKHGWLDPNEIPGGAA
jgi:hypothetical protein